MDAKKYQFIHKRSSFLVGLVCGTLCIGFAHAGTAVKQIDHLKITGTIIQQKNFSKTSSEATQSDPFIGRDNSLSDKMLGEIAGKGVPVNLPSVTRNSNSVVLWDEMQNRSGGGKSSIELGGGNNLQSISMMANR